MLAYEYSTCQGKIEGRLEAIGGAGVRGKLESRNQKRNRKAKKRARNRGRAKLIKTKRLTERSATLANSARMGHRSISGAFTKESCGRRSAARQGRRSTDPRPRGIGGP